MKTSLISLFLFFVTLWAPQICEAKNHKHHKHHKNVRVVVRNYPRRNLIVRNFSPSDNGAYVKSRICPFSCATEGISKYHCRDWRSGNTCYVQDTLDAPASYTPRLYGYYPYPYQTTPSIGEVVGRKVDAMVDQAAR